ncbi:uncharacterized protein LOC102708590 [Oryza brachyantha]|uniref:uncharacterized protein LOC102708590 n=1 Tax=Oryza brachyantha TaxID=4533 RepID=UPI0007764216|nr:uncharacterized protein LOC102708590 [Oryza brachyantha]
MALERLLWFMLAAIRIGHAPQLRVLGYLRPGLQTLDIGGTVIEAGTNPSPATTVPSVQVLALALTFQFSFHLNIMSSFLRCFPNVKTLHVQCKESDLVIRNDVNPNFWNETGPIRCILSSLRTIIVHGFGGHDAEFAFLMFVAENAQMLEDMVILIKEDLREELAAKITALCSTGWASGESKARFVTSRLAGHGIAWSVKAATDFSHDDPFLCL